MEKMKRAAQIMNMVRFAAVILIIASATLYFTAKEYALYPAIVGFALFIFINMPIHIWIAIQNEKIKKQERKKFEAESKDKS
jgi:hypothetical protein